jgi:hypothetical protein
MLTSLMASLRVVLLASIWPTLAGATVVRGTVSLPAELRAAADAPVGHWRIENGVVPVAAKTPDPRSEIVVVLEGKAEGSAKTEAVAAMDLHGLRIDPRVVVVAAGASMLLKNSDRSPHTLTIEGGVMSSTALPAGASRTVKLGTAGVFAVRDEDFPHIEGTVVVVSTPLATVADGQGNFKIDAPEGTYTLRVFYRGQWVLTQPLTLAGRSADVVLSIPSTTAGGR